MDLQKLYSIIELLCSVALNATTLLVIFDAFVEKLHI